MASLQPPPYQDEKESARWHSWWQEVQRLVQNAFKWTEFDFTGSTLNDIEDVNITSVGDDEVLAWDSGSSEWQNQTAAEASLATASQGAKADSALQDVVDDTTPQLGGNLDVNGNKIVSASNGDIDLEPNGTGNVLLGNLTFDADQTVGSGQDNFVIRYDDGDTELSLEPPADLGEYTVAGLPSASTYASCYALATDASGGRTIVRSDGTNWKVVAVEGATVTT